MSISTIPSKSKGLSSSSASSLTTEKEANAKYLADLHKNILYKQTQETLQKDFLSKLNKPINETVNSNNIYKNYPYTDDMVANTNNNDSYSQNDDSLCRIKKIDFRKN
jgi:hypothetical protein